MDTDAIRQQLRREEASLPDSAHRSAVDPDEPWRYVCPNCGGQVHKNKSARDRFRCRKCNESFSKRDLIDQKHDDESRA